MNADLTKKALEKVGNPNVLVNLVSRRVRQLNGLSGGAPARPLISETAGLGAADIALLEIAEGKLGWEFIVPEDDKKEKGGLELPIVDCEKPEEHSSGLIRLWGNRQ